MLYQEILAALLQSLKFTEQAYTQYQNKLKLEKEIENVCFLNKKLSSRALCKFKSQSNHWRQVTRKFRGQTLPTTCIREPKISLPE